MRFLLSSVFRCRQPSRPFLTRAGPMGRLRGLVADGAIKEDIRQARRSKPLPRPSKAGYEAIRALQDRVCDDLQRLFDGLLSTTPVRGLYIHGEVRSTGFTRFGLRSTTVFAKVGTGKTMLMDLFFTSVRESGALPCKRVHFHDWLLAVHEELVRSAIFRSVCHLPSRFQGVSVGCLGAQHECFAVNARVPSCKRCARLH